MQIQTALHEKDPDTGESTGDYSFSRIFASLVGAIGCAIIAGGLYSQLIHDPVRLDMKSAVLYGGGLLVLATLIYSRKIASLAAEIAQERFGKGSNETKE